MAGRRLFLSVVVALVTLAGPAAAAQGGAPPESAKAETATAPDAPRKSLSDAELRQLLKLLEDPERREAFTRRLEALARARAATEPETGKPGSEMLKAVAGGAEQVEKVVGRVGGAVGEAPAFGRWLLDQVRQPELRRRLFLVTGGVLLAVGGGMVAYAILARLLRPWRHRLAAPARTLRSWERLRNVTGRAGLELAPPLALGVVAWALMAVPALTPEARRVTVVLVLATIALSLVRTVVRALFCPDAPAMRLVPLAEETAGDVARRLRWLGGLMVVGWAVLEGVAVLGAPAAVSAFLRHVTGLAVLFLVLGFLRRYHRPVAAWLREADADGDGRARRAVALVRRRVADVWALLAGLYALVLYLIWALSVPGGFYFMLTGTLITVLVVVIWALALGWAERGADRLFDRVAATAFAQRTGIYRAVAHYGLRLVAGGVALGAVLEGWGVGVLAGLESPTGRSLLGALLSVLVIVLVAAAVWEAVNLALTRYLWRVEQAESDLAFRPPSARVRTLLPLLRNILLVTLFVVASLAVLAELGVNVAPLLAGAGVIGIAVGFGSQKLVQDVITGAFILFEDTISIGDWVRAADLDGQVEGLTVRSLRLRDLSGTVHTLPFSAVSTISNLTKDYSAYLLDVGVAYMDDTDTVVRLLKEVDAEMKREPYYARLMLAPLEILGVDRFEESRVVVRARIFTRPMRQWEVGREFNRRIKKHMQDAGLEMPLPHLTVYFGAGPDGRPPPLRVRAADETTTALAPRTPDPET